MKTRAAVLERIGDPSPWTKSRPISVDHIDLDSPQPGEALVRLEAAGVCHSDLSRVNGSRECSVPMVLGHEACGVIEELGSAVDGYQIGDRVALIFLPRCGDCRACQAPHFEPCEHGTAANAAGSLLGGGRRLHRAGTDVHHQNGVSGFATHAVVHTSSLVVIPQDVPAPVGALLGCAVLTGGGAVLNAGRMAINERIAVVGVGGVGLAAMLVAQAVGPAEMLAVDMLTSKLDLAPAYGATLVATPAEIAEHERQYDLVIECVGSTRALETAIKLTRPGGRTVTVGLPSPTTRMEISPLSLVVDTRSLIGSYMGSGDPTEDIQRYAQMYLDGRLPIDRLISAHIKLSQINEAMDALEAGDALRQVIDLAAEHV
ncbi:alcohol dehydrogenase catalytic domain-containing protein [Gordonia humi]|uniref:alcohol dehydrogenase catalytic domain-containing protein n=1 Tax=Gordonia humi TaxID=686429 RepID=UPI00160BEFA0